MKLSTKQISDSKFDRIVGEDDNASSDYEPCENLTDGEDTVVSEVDPESENNDDDSQATTSNSNDNLSTEIHQNLPSTEKKQPCYICTQPKTPKNTLFVFFVWKIILRSSTNYKKLFYFLKLN